ncbi:MAG: PilN domain-containing protein [Candidatus Rokubacteria bacterium]|nr:PilN domain-containing protein [Candidatus Rokubacteria bacterium]
MIGRLRLGIMLRDHRLAVVAVAGARVRQVFTLEASENPAAVLKAELEARRLKVRRVSLALQRSLATVKRLELPPAVGGSLAQMVAFELERHLPFPAEDAAFDFLPLPSARGGPQHVLLVACERRTVDRALRLIEEAHLAPRSLTVACHDLSTLVGKWARTKRAVWVHLVGDEAELLFLEGPRLRLSRSVPVDDETALAGEIGKSLTHLGWEEVGALWVSGDRAEQLLISGDLSGLGIPLTPPPLSPRARGAVLSLGESANGLTLLALAAALAQRRRFLNLLPPALRPRQLSWAQAVTACSFSAAAILGISVLFGQGYQAQRHLARLNVAIRALDPEVKAVERLLAELERKRQLLTTVRAVEESALRPLPFLRELTELMPPDAWLTTLTLDAKGIEISGQAAAANQLIPLLEGSPRLEKVEFASPVTKGRDKEQFRIKGSWETLPKAPALTPAAAPAATKPRGARSP